MSLGIICHPGNPTFAPCDISMDIDPLVIVTVAAFHAFVCVAALVTILLGGK